MIGEVRIALCIYNEDRFLESAIECLLSQTYANISIYIYDACSTDRTGEICKRFMAQRPDRIRFYMSHPKHVSGCVNFNYALGLTHDVPYFMWACGHDLWKPEYVERCVAALEANKARVLVFSRSEIIDIKGNFVRLDPEYVTLHDPVERLAYEIDSLSCASHSFGVYPLEAIKKTRGFLSIPGPDRVLLAEMALIGEFYQLPESLFSLRLTGERSDWKVYSYYQLARREVRRHITLNPVLAEIVAVLHPFWRFGSYLRVIWERTGFAFADKVKLTALMVKSFYFKVFYKLSHKWG